MYKNYISKNTKKYINYIQSIAISGISIVVLFSCIAANDVIIAVKGAKDDVDNAWIDIQSHNADNNNLFSL